MAKINATATSLYSQTGTTSFVGSADPVLTGNNDLSGATTIALPTSSSPSFSNTGEVVLRNSISGFPGLISYYDGSQEISMLGMASADFSATDGYAISYNAGSSKLEMTPVSAGSVGNLVQIARDVTTSDETTTSTAVTTTSLSVSFTPTSASNDIIVIASLYAQTGTFSGTRSQNFSFVRLYKDASEITAMQLGGQFATATSTARYEDTFNICFVESAASTSSRTYTVRYDVGAVTTYITLFGSVFPCNLVVMEVTP